jgi:hypothetical protein
MELAIVESPYFNEDDLLLKRNIAYARLCVAFLEQQGYAAFASHLFYTQPSILNDDDPEDRQKGIDSGFAIARHASVSFVFTDLGVSGGMRAGILDAQKAGRRIQYQSIFQSKPPKDIELMASTLDLFVIESLQGRGRTRRGWTL